MQNCQARLNHLGQHLRADSVQKVSNTGNRYFRPDIFCLSKYFSCFSQNGGSQSMSRQYEKKKLSSGEKFSAINSLRTRDHPYISFVVCRTGRCFVLPQHIYYLTQQTRNMLCYGAVCASYFLQMCYLQRFNDGAEQSKLCSSGIRWRSFFQFTTS